MSTLREFHRKRALKARYDAQIERERNGAPIPGEIAERMTKPIEVVLYQCMVRDGQDVIPVGPRMQKKDSVEMIMYAILGALAQGRLRSWSEPHVVTLFPKPTGLVV